MNLFAKILLSVLTVFVLTCAGFFILTLILLMGLGAFYVAILGVVTATVLFFILELIWGWLNSKKSLMVLVVAFGLVVLSITVFEINRAYHNNIDKIDEQGVDLTLYEPFRENTKAVSLDEKSELTFTKDLPKLDGATALYPLYSAFARATYPEYPYTVDFSKEDKDYVACTNTRFAYDRLINGEVDVIFVAGPSEDQLFDAKAQGVEFNLTPIGREAFVFFVNSKNPIDNLRIDDILNIYSGEATNWSEFGGKNKEIRAFQRPENSGSQTMLQRIMEDTTLMTPPSKDVATGMGGIISEVSAYSNYDNAIGYSFLFFASEMVRDNKIKLISIEGIAPTRENVANKTYPYSAEFYAVTVGTPTENTQKLIDWILSEQGQYLVEKTGYTPIK